MVSFPLTECPTWVPAIMVCVSCGWLFWGVQMVGEECLFPLLWRLMDEAL